MTGTGNAAPTTWLFTLCPQEWPLFPLLLVLWAFLSEERGSGTAHSLPEPQVLLMSASWTFPKQDRGWGSEEALHAPSATICPAVWMRSDAL